ncbi:hypothetical protein PM082_004732 [Marasmius tenuissimus]|nr:hypothetical protein PM082_004732 [Marasmius tenuissimus]
MANCIATEPKAVEAHLRIRVFALHANVDDHPLVELGDKACSLIIDLIVKDPVHKVDEKGYRGFYNVVQDIAKRLESTQAGGNPNAAHSRLLRLEKYHLRRLEKKLDAQYKAALKTHKLPVCTWEDALILTGSIVSTVSAAPGLDVLKSVGGILSQIGELTKTTRGNSRIYGLITSGCWYSG